MLPYPTTNVVSKEELESLRRDAALWNKHKKSFQILEKMLDVASPLVMNKIKAQDATEDAKK